MHRFVILIVLLSLNHHLYSQHIISLDNQLIDLREYDFEISEIKDWRTDKEIGIIYKGLSNKPVIAKIDGDLTSKIRSIIFCRNSETKLIIALKKLKIKEVIQATTEYGYVEVELQSFIKLNSGFKNLGISRQTLKYDGIDVTHMHGRKVSIALKEAFGKIDPSFESMVSTSLEDFYNEKNESSWSKLPIINLKMVKHGLYKSFYALKNNDPDSVVNFQIKKGRYPTLLLKNSKGKFREYDEEAYYLVANSSGVYIGFDNNYYKTAVKNGKWVFVGPRRSDISAINNGVNAAGLVGAFVVGAATKDQFIYQINTLDGSVKAVKKIR